MTRIADLKKKHHQQRHNHQAQRSFSLPTSLGKLGSIFFFVALFALADPTPHGLQVFRKCHQNCISGVLHGILMPVAVCGVFCIVRAVSDDKIFTRWIQFVIVALYTMLYVEQQRNEQQDDDDENQGLIPILLFVVSHFVLFDRILYQTFLVRKDVTRTTYFWTGTLIIAANVGTLEVVAHGVLGRICCFDR